MFQTNAHREIQVESASLVVEVEGTKSWENDPLTHGFYKLSNPINH